jgi:hypothetical protein
VARTAWEACALSWLRPSTRRTELFIVLYFPFCVRCPSNAFEPADDRLSNLVGTVLLHEVETPDDDAVLVREAARQSPDSAVTNTPGSASINSFGHGAVFSHAE